MTCAGHFGRNVSAVNRFMVSEFPDAVQDLLRNARLFAKSIAKGCFTIVQ